MEAAVGEGDAKKVADLIRKYPDFDVNRQDVDGFTLLNRACFFGKSSVIPLLLAHPDIDVNVKNRDGTTPFHFACVDGSASCVREMLKDSRVKVNEPSDDGFTPLWSAASSGHLDAIKWWIASGREIDFGKTGNEKTDAIGVAKERENTRVVNLLERLKSDAVQTRSEVKMEFRINGKSVSQSTLLISLSFLSSFPFWDFTISLFSFFLFFFFSSFFFFLFSFLSFYFRFPCDHSTKAHQRAIRGFC